MDAWELPGPKVFIDGVERSLRGGASVVVWCPRRMVSDFDAAVRERCGFGTWTVVQPAAGQAPVNCLTERFARSQVSVGELCYEDRFQGRVIWMNGIAKGDWTLWREFLGEYARISRNVGRLERTRFVVVVAGCARDEMVGDVALDVHEWRDVVREMDLLLLAYVRMEGWALGESLRMLAAVTVARVAAWDVGVAERMMRSGRVGEVLEPTRTLRAMAVEEGWTEKTLEEWEWGTASWEGVCHAALAAIKKPQELRRRIWSAQSSVLLPLIDEQRYELVRRHEKRIGGHLRERKVGRDAYSLEIGELADLFRELSVERKVWRRAERLRAARNALAHLRPLGGEVAREVVRG